MKQKSYRLFLIWPAAFVALSFFFYWFGAFSFEQAAWPPFWLSIALALAVSLIGAGSHYLFRRLAPRGYNLLLALFPVCLSVRLLVASAFHPGFTYIMYVLGSILLLWGLAWLLSRLRWRKKRQRYSLTALIGLGLLCFASGCLPDRYDMDNRLLDEMACLSKGRRWDAIIGLCRGREMPDAISRSFLNLALAEKGSLGNRLFYFDQFGVLGLLPTYDRSPQLSLLLGDIHFLIGDLALSESYEMEALTVKGSPQAMQRLAQISLLRHDWALAGKYLFLLQQKGPYKQWALQEKALLRHPEKFAEDPELKGKQFPKRLPDTLLGLESMDSLWQLHLKETPPNRTAYEYLGCSYLLGKKMDLFRKFLRTTMTLPVGKPLPLHFQEAALMAFGSDTKMLDSLGVSLDQRKRYAAYLGRVLRLKSREDLMNLYQTYGNTFWFYYQFKKL
ncbi:MAG: DUF6057 family protein [Tannerella sp.]|jgi:hypothetical protein|nr:DUF6057 family protein [Tannerella sp.]